MQCRSIRRSGQPTCAHVEFMHEMPGYTAFLRRLSTFARVVTFNKRSQGLSDRISDAPSLEQRMDDVRVVMDDVGSARSNYEIFGRLPEPHKSLAAT
jgi:hypothetical protein